MLSRVRWQLTAWYVAVLLFVIAAVSGVAYFVLSRSLEAEVNDSLRSSAYSLVAQIEANGEVPAQVLGPSNAIPAQSPRESDDDEDDDDHRNDRSKADARKEEDDDDGPGLEYFRGLGSDALYLILAPDGTVVLNPLNVATTLLVDASAVAETVSEGEAWRTDASADGTIRTLYLLASHDGDPIAVVQVGRSLESHERQLNELLRVMLGTGAGGLAIATVGGFLLAGRSLRPTRDAMQKQRQFVADASHELRTPLTLIRASAEAVQRSASGSLQSDDRASLEDIVGEVDRMSVLVEDLLLLAKLDERELRLRLEEVSTAGLVEQTLRQARLLADGKGLVIEANIHDAGTIVCDVGRVSQVLRILLDNALRYTPQGGRIDIGLEGRGNKVELWVENSGSSIAIEDLPRLFERFYRMDPSRGRSSGGSGLGLSIARRLVEAHGGQIAAENVRDGDGVRFSVVLPRKAAGSRSTNIAPPS